MDGRRPSFRPTGRFSGGQHPQQQPPPPPPGVPHRQHHPADMDPNFNPQLQNMFLQNLANNYFQNFAFQRSFLPQNPNFPIHNFGFQNPSMNPHHQPLPNSSAAQQLHGFSALPPMATLPPPPPPPQTSSSSEQRPEDLTTIKQRPPTAPPFEKAKPMKLKKSKKLLAKIDRTAEKARQDLVAAREGVTTWKVSQNVLSALQVDSWESLGFRMQEIPSLHRLIVTEGKVNAFINCLVAVWRITSLYDLQVAVCQSQDVDRFEDLDLGPLLQHPLVLHYFVDSNVTEVFQITREDIISDLHEFMDSIKKKQIIVDEFLDFIAEKRSVVDKAKLGVRIENLGIYISYIREAKRSEDEVLKRWKIDSVKNSDNTSTKQPPVNHHKNLNNLEERFSAICQRVESFSSSQKVFCGKHIRFGSSSSEDEEIDDCSGEDEMTPNNHNGHSKIPSQDLSGSFRLNSCPYPSATEERSRLGLQGSVSQSSHAADGKSCGIGNKRKHLREKGTVSAPSKFLKVEKFKQNDMNDASTSGDDSALLSDNTMKKFIATWKEACNEYSVDKVLDKMLKFYNPAEYKRTTDSKTIDRRMRRTRKNILQSIKSAIQSQPFIGLLNVAVSSIKLGMWDSIYDTFQAITQQDTQGYENIDVEAEAKYTSGDVKAERKGTPINYEQNRQTMKCISVEDIVEKIAMYCELDHEFWSNCKSGVENRFIFMQKLCSCEHWLVGQFGVNEFNSLGHGEFFVFLEKNVPFLPAEVRIFLGNEPHESPSLEVHILQDQLILLVSQASNNLWQNEPITKQMISAMFARQFPSFSANVAGDCSSECFLATVAKHKSSAISNNVLFSATLLESHHVCDQLAHSESSRLETFGSVKMSLSSVASKAAIDVLLQAPMLSDLNLWSHWDLKFAQSLGSLQDFLSREVTTRELICLVTRDGKVIRLHHSATADTFLEAAVQGSPFQTAVELLSFFSLTGGEKHAPMSLLKSYACHAFGVILNIPTNSVDVQGCEDNHVVAVTGSKDLNTPVSVASRFFLDCIGYLPAEFHCFVADVLLAGMQSVTVEAPSAILVECSGAERLMLHEIGLSIDISAWVKDHDACGVGSTHLPKISESLLMDVARSELSTEPRCKQDLTNEKRLASSVKFSCDNGVTNSSPTVDNSLVSSHTVGSGLDCNNDKEKDAASVIDCIRRSEFGLIPNLSSFENDMLAKQHARLGRALHCLSQELYSQDSHFLLELVQNADDNTYPENMEPTLVFILQESGIVVLNNEHGFSPQNIKALCDVGNSTKKRSGAGYIGKKGIGFKSVFRVTDAPQIHSNGFHIKFDISVGQIGFVLPTVVPPCNVDFYSGLVSGGNDQLDSNCWNTCIVLPFRSKISVETTTRMFVDLHPSLLLFLHRLKCIMFRNTLSDSLVIMRKEIVGDGIVNVTWGGDKMTWLVASQNLQAHSSRPKVQATEIAVAFTLKESENSYYTPCLEQQPVFAFLPLRAYGLKFILQGDFILTSSREEVDRNNPWNEWLLANFPLLFVAAEKSFCALSCFKEKPGKAVTAYMSFVPLVGEVHGFFSGLPRAISLELRRTQCLFLEGDATNMVFPGKVLRGWNDEARILLPEVLLQEHLGLGFLDQNIVLHDSLASALGITEYGPEILIRFTKCLCCIGNGLQLMGIGWLSFLLDALYRMLPNSNGENCLLDSLRGLPFVPLSDGTYSSSDAGTIWLHSDVLSTGLLGTETFPKLYAELRIVNPVLLSASAADGASPQNIVRMLHRIGVQPLSAHEIIKVHIFNSISDLSRDSQSMTDYLCFLMIHMQSSCNMCHTERKAIMSELKRKAYILTNNGYKRLGEAPIHFSRELGNPVDVRKFNDVLKMEWHEVDVSYLKHPSIESLSGGLTKWREFLMEIGVTDFVQVVQTERSITELSSATIKQMLCDAKLISPDYMAKDWESKELVHLLSLLSARGDAKCCEHVLDILDTLWDGSFSDKVSGICNGNTCDDFRPFKSSFISSLRDAQWVVSSMDNELHYPKDLFHDCDTVQSILGSFAPYATPKVKSETLLADIGFKTKVSLDDALNIAGAWRKLNTPFKASISQMSRFYSFISEELASSKKNVQEAFPGPFIFVPFKTASNHNLASGVFVRPEEVYWDDQTGSFHQMKLLQQRSSATMHQKPLDKTLCHVYPGLHDFFVNQCGVCETPSYSSYLDVLRQLATLALPFEPASAVFKVFSRWSSGFKSGLLSSADLVHLKECLLKLEYTILPTASNKWMSLHASFGVVCWCDNAELSKDFKHLDNINFLYFGKLKDNEEEILHKEVSELLRVLGIPALSEVISRQAIYFGPTDSSFKASLIDWALPYAQRYMHSTYPNNYAELQQNGFEAIKKLKVVVVEKLFYKNVIKRCGISSQNRSKCSCLLQDETLYSTVATDPHALFLELSRLFLNGTPDLHLANFLHMITTMAESGSTMDQTEFFILNCQKIPKLPEEEVLWSLSSPTARENGESLQTDIASMAMDEEGTLIKSNTVSSTVENGSKSLKYPMEAGLKLNWPPADWKTAPAYGPHAGNRRIEVPTYGGIEKDQLNTDMIPTEGEVRNINFGDWTVRDDPGSSTSQPGCEAVNDNLSLAYNQAGGVDGTVDPAHFGLMPDQAQRLSSGFARRDRFSITGGSSDQAMATGRSGEEIAFRYLTGKYGREAVRWVNETQETGLPYDMVVTEHEHGEQQYIEVKATLSARKDFFFISAREWQFAVEKGDAYSILHILLGNHNAMVTLFKNPVKQCQQGKLRLVVVMPTQQNGGELFPLLDATLPTPGM